MPEKQQIKKEYIMKKMLNDSNMLEEYDFSNAERGKYSKAYSEGSNVVVIDKDIIQYFPNHDAVNQALRSIIPIIKRHESVVRG